MKITGYSKIKLMETADYWRVPKEYFDPLYNYLIFGFSPGGFWTAVLANDFHGAIQRSHPANQVEALKHVSGWINDLFPRISWGSYAKVDGWTEMSSQQRRRHLEGADLIYTEQQEVQLALKGTPIKPEPLLFG